MQRTCLYCGASFRAKRATRKYCSDNCKQLAYFKRNGMVFGVNGLQPSPDPATNFTVNPIVKPDNVKSVNQSSVKNDAVKAIVPVSVKENTLKSLSVKSDADNVKPEQVFMQKQQEVAQTLSDNKVREIINAINAALDVKLERFFDNVKKELDVKYASLYANWGLAQNTLEGEPVVPLCAQIPFTGVVIKGSETLNLKPTEDVSVNFDVKDGNTFIVKSDVKDDPYYLTNEGEKEDKIEDTESESLFTESEQALPTRMQYVDFPDDEDEREDKNELYDMDEEGGEENEHGNDNEFYDNTERITQGETEQQPESKQETTEEVKEKLQGLTERAEKVLPEKEQKSEEGADEAKGSEPEYHWFDSAYLFNVMRHYENDNGGDLLKDNTPDSDWVDVRLLCLIESVIKLNSFAHIDNETLRSINDAFNLLVNSRAFLSLPSYHPFLNTAIGLADLVSNLEKTNRNTPKPRVRLSFKKKAELVAIRLMMTNAGVQRKKFSELDFNDAQPRVQNKNVAKEKGVWDRYKDYVAQGLIDDDGEDEEDNEETDYHNLKLKENPYNVRIRYFHKYGKFPAKAA